MCVTGYGMCVTSGAVVETHTDHWLEAITDLEHEEHAWLLVLFCLRFSSFPPRIFLREPSPKHRDTGENPSLGVLFGSPPQFPPGEQRAVTIIQVWCSPFKDALVMEGTRSLGFFLGASLTFPYIWILLWHSAPEIRWSGNIMVGVGLCRFVWSPDAAAADLWNLSSLCNPNPSQTLLSVLPIKMCQKFSFSK